MTIVSDTTPVRYLVEIGEVHVLEALFGAVVIPQAVSVVPKFRRHSVIKVAPLAL